jgi:hypothetical protein
MGYLGMFAGALVLFQITQIPVVQCYWLLALAYLFSGRWPTGVPEAWRTGRAVPWGSSAEIRAKRAAGVAGGAVAAQRPRGWSWGGKPTTPSPAAPQASTAAGDPSDPRTRATTSKRKRKRRR